MLVKAVAAAEADNVMLMMKKRANSTVQTLRDEAQRLGRMSPAVVDEMRIALGSAMEKLGAQDLKENESLFELAEAVVDESAQWEGGGISGDAIAKLRVAAVERSRKDEIDDLFFAGKGRKGEKAEARMEKDIQEVASGNFKKRFVVRKTDEMKALATSLDKMTQSLRDDFDGIKQEISKIENTETQDESKKSLNKIKEILEKFVT